MMTYQLVEQKLIWTPTERNTKVSLLANSETFCMQKGTRMVDPIVRIKYCGGKYTGNLNPRRTPLQAHGRGVFVSTTGLTFEGTFNQNEAVGLSKYIF